MPCRVDHSWIAVRLLFFPPFYLSPGLPFSILIFEPAQASSSEGCGISDRRETERLTHLGRHPFRHDRLFSRLFVLRFLHLFFSGELGVVGFGIFIDYTKGFYHFSFMNVQAHMLFKCMTRSAWEVA